MGNGNTKMGTSETFKSSQNTWNTTATDVSANQLLGHLFSEFGKCFVANGTGSDEAVQESSDRRE